MAKRKDKDVFDWLGKKMATALVGSCDAIDGFNEPFRSGGITALEEFHYRFTGKHFDWEDFKLRRAAYENRSAVDFLRAASRGGGTNETLNLIGIGLNCHDVIHPWMKR